MWAPRPWASSLALLMAEFDRVDGSGWALTLPVYSRFVVKGQPLVGITLDYLDYRQLTVAQGETLTTLGDAVLGADAATAGTLTSCTLILLSAVLTTLGWYQKLAAKAGAGSLVPITGFANAVVSAAIEFKAEGRVPGTGAKIFLIAGPVIVYGTLAAVVYGGVLWLLGG